MLNKNLKQVKQWIKPGAKVLDVGCGQGEVLESLISSHQITGYGIEMNLKNVQACIAKNLNVYQADIESVLHHFPEKSYDFVILSYTLQEIQNPIKVLNEMLRIGKEVIVSFPNFAYYQNRLHLLLKGQAPISKQLPFEWHNTPNIRVMTLLDFTKLCEQEEIQIQKQFPSYPLANFLSESGLFLIQR